MMYQMFRSLLWTGDPETVHHMILKILTFLPKQLFLKVPDRPVNALGLIFPNPIGLAAGFDVNGQYLSGLNKLGFGFIEVGGVTPRRQLGQPKPRIFRIPESYALINRMGFCNDGVDALVARIEASKYRGILGVNIAKNTDTGLDKAFEDYVYCLQRLYPHVNYITINISSPNMPELRTLQQSAYFSDLMSQLREEQLLLADKYGKYIPLLVKVSPDEPDDSLKRMANCLVGLGIDGMILTNTTIQKTAVAHYRHGHEKGGLSGRPLAFRSLMCLRIVKSIVGNELTLIAAGGIDSPNTAQERLEAGAHLLQLYTGLVYHGPALIRQLVQSLNQKD